LSLSCSLCFSHSLSLSLSFSLSSSLWNSSSETLVLCTLDLASAGCLKACSVRSLRVDSGRLDRAPCAASYRWLDF
jgi:hypothetical protein